MDNTTSPNVNYRSVYSLQSLDEKGWMGISDTGSECFLIPQKAEENGKTRPKHLGMSAPKYSSTLITTTNHPLMSLGSPDSVENYPDVVPKKTRTVQEEPKNISLCSTDDEKNTNETNSSTDLYSPQLNTSKSNLYEFYDTSRVDNLTSRPDVAWDQGAGETGTGCRKMMPVFRETDLPGKITCFSGPERVLGHVVDGDEGSILSYGGIRNKKRLSGCIHSTPNKTETEEFSILLGDEFHTGVADWVSSPSQLHTIPNFRLPIKLSDGPSHDLDSPDVLSSSTQEDRSSYQATVDPASGSVALRHNTGARPGLQQRRRIMLPPEQDSCSGESELSSLDSDEGAPPRPPHSPPAPDAKGGGGEDKGNSSPRAREYGDPIPEYTAAEERRQERGWLRVTLADGGRANCDMRVIEPFKRVVSHGGYECAGAAIIVFSACYLPDSARVDYTYVMDNLFLYVIWSLERLVTEDYVLVYLHGSAPRCRLPTWRWLHECYRLIDRRLRKSLKHLYLVHPTFWLKSIVLLSKPFVSYKFHRKLSYVHNLNELMDKVPVEPNAIPDLVKSYDLLQRGVKG